MGSRAVTDERRTRPTPGYRAVLIAATVVIAMMPSAYRGGAEAAHPHAFFQFWITGEGAAHRHHGADAEGAHHGHAPGDLAHPHDEASGATGKESPVAPAIPPSGETSDLPKLSKMTAPGGFGTAMPLLSDGPLFAAPPAPVRWAPVWTVATPVGRTTAPEPPPPRDLPAVH